jgi:ribosomal protein L40E
MRIGYIIAGIPVGLLGLGVTVVGYAGTAVGAQFGDYNAVPILALGIIALLGGIALFFYGCFTSTEPIKIQSTPPRQQLIMVCPRCRSRISPDVNFCPRCGTDLRPIVN